MNWFLRGVAPVGLVLALLLGGTHDTRAGHDEGEQPLFYPQSLCISEAPIVRLFELSKVGYPSEAALLRFWDQQTVVGLCRDYPPRLFLRFPFWFDQIARDDLFWADGDRMIILQGHDKSGFTVYTWGPKSEVEKLLLRGE